MHWKCCNRAIHFTWTSNNAVHCSLHSKRNNTAAKTFSCNEARILQNKRLSTRFTTDLLITDQYTENKKNLNKPLLYQLQLPHSLWCRQVAYTSVPETDHCENITILHNVPHNTFKSDCCINAWVRQFCKQHNTMSSITSD